MVEARGSDLTGLKVLKNALLLTCVAWPGVAAAQEALPTIEVVGISPGSGGGIDREKVPSNVQTIGAVDLDHAKTPSLLDGMVQALPGVSLSDQSGNAFQRNLDYRGFSASPVLGTPQGLAVYQNGTRVNEAFGDVMNWDLIPERAIKGITLMPSNPVFGLNAIGGALSIDMKNGFNYQGTEVELMGGSFGRLSGGAQSGWQNGAFSTYIAVDAANDNGWRDFSSSSTLRRIYADIGARGDQTEFHLSFTGADNKLGGVVGTPIEMLNQRWSSVYTWPQSTHLQLAMLQASAKWTPTDVWTLEANAYLRSFRSSHFDGNGTDAQACDPGGAFPGEFCFQDDNGNEFQINRNTAVLNTLPADTALGQIDRNETKSTSYGGSLQATSTGQLFGHDNHFVVGTSLDHGRSQFQATSELATVDQNLFVTGTGVFIDQPAADVIPVDLTAQEHLCRRLRHQHLRHHLAAGVHRGRPLQLRRQIDLQDTTGNSPLLNSSNQFQRFNPVVGLTYRVTPNLTAYAGYSEANRAPTPLELGCADPQTPCQIDNFLIADPPLKQVVSHTVEAGLRGELSGGAGPLAAMARKAEPVADNGWRLRWGIGLFRTENTDDIINVASEFVPNFGYFKNAGTTLRQGVEAKVDLSWDRWTAYANYTFIDATFQSALIDQRPQYGHHRQRRARQPHSRNSGASIQGRRGIRHHRCLEARRGPQCRRQPVSAARRRQHLSQGAGLLGREPAQLLQGDEERGGVRAGAEPVQPALLLRRHRLQYQGLNNSSGGNNLSRSTIRAVCCRECRSRSMPASGRRSEAVGELGG